MTIDVLRQLTLKSRALHGHRYVLPVALVLGGGPSRAVSASDVLDHLPGRVDRPRVLEALQRLVELEAMDELPRDDRPNATRYFTRRDESPYWAFIDAFVPAAVHAEVDN